jgi:transcriptional regulator with XRE-family HTH domain
MESTSREDKATVPRRDRAYYRKRQQNRVHGELAAYFADEAAAGRITKSKLAERLGKDPAQITRWLSEASNLELDTISDILLAMGAEMDHHVVRFSDRAKQTYIHPISAKIIGPQAKTTMTMENAKIVPVAANSESGSVRLLVPAE